MKRILPVALVALAFAAVPVAFADNGRPNQPPPAAQQGTGAPRLASIAARLRWLEVRFVHRCGTAASTAPAGCVAFAQRLEQRLQKVDGRLQALIQKIQTTCTAGNTDPRCQNADRKIARLQRLDTGVQKLAAKLQGWLDS